jgi:hypothetical protein
MSHRVSHRDKLLPRMLPPVPLFVPRARIESGKFRTIPVFERIPNMTEHSQDEILELVWTLREEGRATRSQLLRRTEEEQPERLLEELSAAGLLEASDDEIRLTKPGEELAPSTTCSTSTTARSRAPPANSSTSLRKPSRKASARSWDTRRSAPTGGRSPGESAATRYVPRSSRS